jgi:hypothetical protein
MWDQSNIISVISGQMGAIMGRSISSEGPHPLEDMFKMFAVCIMLEHSFALESMKQMSNLGQFDELKVRYRTMMPPRLQNSLNLF